MNNWVRWSAWSEDGCVNFGQMPKRSVQEELRVYEIEAKKVLEKTGADHVLYGVKHYSEEDELIEVRFYMLPMDDERFEKDVACKKGLVVYALHKKQAKEDQ